MIAQLLSVFRKFTIGQVPRGEREREREGVREREGGERERRCREGGEGDEKRERGEKVRRL